MKEEVNRGNQRFERSIITERWPRKAMARDSPLMKDFFTYTRMEPENKRSITTRKYREEKKGDFFSLVHRYDNQKKKKEKKTGSVKSDLFKLLTPVTSATLFEGGDL